MSTRSEITDIIEPEAVFPPREPDLTWEEFRKLHPTQAADAETDFCIENSRALLDEFLSMYRATKRACPLEAIAFINLKDRIEAHRRAAISEAR